MEVQQPGSHSSLVPTCTLVTNKQMCMAQDSPRCGARVLRQYSRQATSEQEDPAKNPDEGTRTHSMRGPLGSQLRMAEA